MSDGRSSTEVVRRDSLSYHVTVGWYGNGTALRSISFPLSTPRHPREVAVQPQGPGDSG